MKRTQRYKLVSLTGYTLGAGGGGVRKKRVTWYVLDRLWCYRTVYEVDEWKRIGALWRERFPPAELQARSKLRKLEKAHARATRLRRGEKRPSATPHTPASETEDPSRSRPRPSC